MNNRIAEQDPLHGLLLETAVLLPGDILLFRAMAQSELEEEISAETGSPYTHAAVYLGSGEFLEADGPGVQIRTLGQAEINGYIIGVLRTQYVFSSDRVERLKAFAKDLIECGARFDRRGMLLYERRKASLEANLQELLEKNFGKITSNEDFARKSYFCSALVVACYIVVGIIDDTAQLAYQPDTFSPADLYRDATFGWFLGYIAADNDAVPLDDPLMNMTLWRDFPELRWWLPKS